MRHAPRSTFSDAAPVTAAKAHRAPGWRDAALAMAASILSLPGRVAANRRDVALLGRMAAHELADIGLSRQDVWDAAALPLGHSPGTLLTGRAAERRRAERSVLR